MAPMPERLPLVATTADSPWGAVHIAAGEPGVVAIETLGTAEGFAAGLARRGFGPPVPLTPATGGSAARIAADARDAVEAILAGDPVDTNAVPLDLGDRPEWDRLVLEAVRAI